MSVGPWSSDKASPRGQWREEEERTGGRTVREEKRQERHFFHIKREKKIAHNMLTLQVSGEEWCWIRNRSLGLQYIH